MFWNALTANYFNTSLLTIHTEFVSVQDTFLLYWSSNIKHDDNEPWDFIVFQNKDKTGENSDKLILTIVSSLVQYWRRSITRQQPSVQKFNSQSDAAINLLTNQ